MLYLDHAATSHPKPPEVLDAMQHWYRDVGVSAARGSSQRCAEAERTVQRARRATGALCGLPAGRVAFTSGATESINLFLRAFLQPGDLVLTTAFEHSSVARPLVALQRELPLRLRVLPPDADGGIDPATVGSALRESRPRLFVFTHASNVTGARFDAAAFCELARAAGATTLLDASQTAGHCAIDAGADAYAFSAHKALLGPPGLGVLAVRDGVDLRPAKQGGTGSSRALDEHPVDWPVAFEAGTPNTPAIFGLDAALRVLTSAVRAARATAALEATARLQDALSRVRGVRLVLPPGERVPVLSFVHDSLDPAEVAALFDQHDVHVRTGHHCAPWLHRWLGTEAAGTVRLSPGPELSEADTRAVSAALVP